MTLKKEGNKTNEKLIGTIKQQQNLGAPLIKVASELLALFE